MHTPRAVFYARTATAQVADPSKAIESQLRIMQQYCEGNNIEVINSFYDIAGGNTFERTGFIEMMDYVSHPNNIINLILITNWDRFSRNYPQMILKEQQLSLLGIKLLVTEPANAFAEFLMQKHNNCGHVHS